MIDITKEVKYEDCEDINGKFMLLSYKGIPIAEIKLRDAWYEGKKIEECFKVVYCENHPVDYVWINLKTK
ncbi:MAG: hypothetical protein AABY15_06215 [Nanoarchaeota archaeon]